MKGFSDKKAILFDLDGTVINSTEGIFNALYYMFDKLDIKLETSDGLTRFMGPSIAATLRTHYGFEAAAADAAVSIYREYYSVKGLYECVAYEGIPALLKTLKAQGKQIGLATKKPELFSVKIIESLGLSDYFDVICGASLSDNGNSKKEIIERAIAALGSSKEDTVMVGDTEYDIVGANEAEIASIGVLYGFGEEESIACHNPTLIVTDVAALSKILTEGEENERI